MDFWAKDEKLWTDFRSGCDDCFKVIYDTHARELLIYGKRLNNDYDLVANCVQELFANLIDRRSHLGPTNNIRFYLIKSFRTVLIKELKKNKMVSAEPLKIEREGEMQDSVEDQIIFEENNNERNDHLHSAISHLSPREREILYLKYYSNVSNKEIAELLSISYQSVKNTATRAIQKLKEEMMNVA